MSDPTPPPRALFEDRVAVVVNGNAKRVTADLVDVLDQVVRTGDLFVSRSLPEADEIAHTIVRRGYPTVLTAGGDGTFVQMVTKITREAGRSEVRAPRFGLLRLGTGNALAWVLGAQNPRRRGVIADLGRLRQHGGSRAMRFLEVEGMLTPFAGIGADAVALADYSATKERMRQNPLTRRFSAGGLAYLTAVVTRTMPGYLVRPTARVTITSRGAPAFRLDRDGAPVQELPAGDVLYEGPARIVAMSTIPYWGFGARVFPFAGDREDRFSLRVADLSSWSVAWNIRDIWNGSYRADGLHDFLCDGVAIRCDDPTPLQIGGDPVGSRDYVEARIAPEPVEVVDYYAPPPV